MTPLHALLPIGLLALSGCDRVIGPEPIRTATVSGRVMIQSRPVTSGWVEFVPVGGTLGRLRSAKLRPDGTFTARGVPVGRVGLRHGGPEPPRTGDRRIDDVLYVWHRVPLIERTIREGENPPLAIDLRDETSDLERKRREATGPGPDR